MKFVSGEETRDRDKMYQGLQRMSGAEKDMTKRGVCVCGGSRASGDLYQKTLTLF